MALYLLRHSGYGGRDSNRTERWTHRVLAGVVAGIIPPDTHGGSALCSGTAKGFNGLKQLLARKGLDELARGGRNVG